MKIKALSAVLACIVLLASCNSTPDEERYYYTLRYNSISEDPELIQNSPINMSVWVRDASISRSYSRKQIVVRHFGPRISYLDNHFWANELENKIPELVAQRFKAYRLFETTRRDFPYSRPDYELVTTLTSLEFQRGERTPQATLHLRFELREMKSGREGSRETKQISKEIEETIPVYDHNLDSFVQVINEAILDYTDRFVTTVLSAFDRAPLQETSSDLRMERPEEEIPENRGQLLMPGVFEGRDAGVYKVISKEGTTHTGNFGVPLSLAPGHYTVRYGSGSQKQQLHRTVQIREDYRTIVEPDYGGLQVEAVNLNGRPAELAYEIFDADTGTSYGTGYTIKSVAEEERKTWVLPTGRYKVTINNRPFSTGRDYTAVYVEKGKGNLLTISVTREEGETYRVVGGGAVKEPLYTPPDENWILKSSIAGNLTGNLSNVDTFSTYTRGFSANGFLQNRLRYTEAPFKLSLLNLVEIGATRSESGIVEVNRDLIEFDSTLIMDVILNLGLYLNLDVSTHFLPRYYRESESFDYTLLDPQENKIKTGNGQSVQTHTPFLPTSLQEGTGVNIAIAEGAQFDMSTRFGLGLRQHIYGDSYPVKNTSTTPLEFQQQEDEFTTGMEAALLLSSRFLNDFTYTTRLEAYTPFENISDFSLEWSHDLQFSIFRNFTINYRAGLYNETNPEGDIYIASDHGLYLRFSTVFNMSF